MDDGNDHDHNHDDDDDVMTEALGGRSATADATTATTTTTAAPIVNDVVDDEQDDEELQRALVMSLEHVHHGGMVDPGHVSSSSSPSSRPFLLGGTTNPNLRHDDGTDMDQHDNNTVDDADDDDDDEQQLQRALKLSLMDVQSHHGHDHTDGSQYHTSQQQQQQQHQNHCHQRHDDGSRKIPPGATSVCTTSSYRSSWMTTSPTFDMLPRPHLEMTDDADDSLV